MFQDGWCGRILTLFIFRPFSEERPVRADGMLLDPREISTSSKSIYKRRCLIKRRSFFVRIDNGFVVRNKSPTSNTSSIPFPLVDFRYFSLQFLGSFSSFAHATYSLSVFWQYLDLRGLYLALCAPIPRYTTLCSGGVRYAKL